MLKNVRYKIKIRYSDFKMWWMIVAVKLLTCIFRVITKLVKFTSSKDSMGRLFEMALWFGLFFLILIGGSIFLTYTKGM